VAEQRLGDSWRRQFPVDADVGPPSQVQSLLAAQSPLLATAWLGLPGLAVPTGVVDGLPLGVQIVTARFRDDLALRAGEVVERAAGWSVMRALGA
jgi:amidase